MPTLTIDDLGKAVKKKYAGQYDDLPDAEVGRRVQQKFPGAYDDYSAPVAAAPVLSPVQSPALPATAPTGRPPMPTAAVPAPFPVSPPSPTLSPTVAVSQPPQIPAQPVAAPLAPGAIIDPASAERLAIDNAQKLAAHITGQNTISADTPTFLQDLAHRVTAPFVGPGSAFGIAQGKREGSKEAAGKDQFEAPLVDFEANQDKVTGGPITTGFTKGAQKFLSGWTTPKSIQLLLATGGMAAEANLGKLAAALEARGIPSSVRGASASFEKLAEVGAKYMPRIRALVSGGFSLDMIHSALQQSPELIKQIKKGDLEGATATLTEMAGTLGMAALSGRHAATEAGPDLKAAGRAVVEKLENAPDVHGFSQTGDSDTGIAYGAGERKASVPRKAKPAKAKPATAPKIEYSSTGQPIRKAPAIVPEEASAPEPATAAPETKTPAVETKAAEPETKAAKGETTAPKVTLIDEAGILEKPEAEPETIEEAEPPEAEASDTETLKYRAKGNDKIDVHINQHPEGWTVHGDYNLQGQAGGHLGDSGYKVYHPTRQAALDAFLESAVKPGRGPQYDANSGSSSPKLKARAEAMVSWLKGIGEPAQTVAAPEKLAKPEAPPLKGAALKTRMEKIRDIRKATGLNYAEAAKKLDEETAAVDAGEPAQPSQPVAATEEVGPHGPITRSYKENPRAALAWLRSRKNGFAADAVPNEQIGPIGLPYGVEGDAADDYRGGYGVAHIDARHPGWLDAHADDIATWKVDQEFPDREGRISAVRLTDGKGNRAMVSRDWNGKPNEQWLLTGYERSASVASVGVHETPKGAVPTFAATDRSDTSVLPDARIPSGRTTDVPKKNLSTVDETTTPSGVEHGSTPSVADEPGHTPQVTAALDAAAKKRIAAIDAQLAKLQAQYEKRMNAKGSMVPPAIKADALKSLAKMMDKLGAERARLTGNASNAIEHATALAKDVAAIDADALTEAEAKAWLDKYYPASTAIYELAEKTDDPRESKRILKEATDLERAFQPVKTKYDALTSTRKGREQAAHNKTVAEAADAAAFERATTIRPRNPRVADVDFRGRNDPPPEGYKLAAYKNGNRLLIATGKPGIVQTFDTREWQWTNEYTGPVKAARERFNTYNETELTREALDRETEYIHGAWAEARRAGKTEVEAAPETPPPPEPKNLQEARAEKYLSNPVNTTDFGVITRKQRIEKRLEAGGKVEAVEVEDEALRNKITKEYEVMNRGFNVPWGNERHPKTIAAQALKDRIAAGNFTKTEYRLFKDGETDTFTPITKIEYDYARSTKAAAPETPPITLSPAAQAAEDASRENTAQRHAREELEELNAKYEGPGPHVALAPKPGTDAFNADQERRSELREQLGMQIWQRRQKAAEIAQGIPPENHRQLVERAIADGKEVPPEVLADYPDLKEKADEKSRMTYMGAKQFWAKTRAEIEQEGKEAVKAARGERASLKLKGTPEFAKWRIKSMSLTAKAAIKSAEDYYKGLLGVHKARVEEALSEGKPVPPEVLADYPDLKPAQPVAAIDTDGLTTPQYEALSRASDADFAALAKQHGLEAVGPSDRHGSWLVRLGESKKAVLFGELRGTTTSIGPHRLTVPGVWTPENVAQMKPAQPSQPIAAPEAAKPSEPSAAEFDRLSKELARIEKLPAYAKDTPEGWELRNRAIELREHEIDFHRPAAVARAQAEIDAEKGKGTFKPLPKDAEATFQKLKAEGIADRLKAAHLTADPIAVRETYNKLSTGQDGAAAVVGERGAVIHKKVTEIGRGRNKEKRSEFTASVTDAKRPMLSRTFFEAKQAAAWATDLLHSLGVPETDWKEYGTGVTDRFMRTGNLLENSQSGLIAADAAAKAIGKPELAHDIYSQVFEGGWKGATDADTIQTIAAAYADRLPRNETALETSGRTTPDKERDKLYGEVNPSKGYSDWEGQVESYERSAKGIAQALEGVRKRIAIAEFLNGGSTPRIAESVQFFDQLEKNVAKNLAFVKDAAAAETKQVGDDLEPGARAAAEAYAAYGMPAFENERTGTGGKTGLEALSRFMRIRGIEGGYEGAMEHFGIAPRPKPARIEIPTTGGGKLTKGENETLEKADLINGTFPFVQQGVIEKLRDRGWVEGTELTDLGKQAVYSFRMDKAEGKAGLPMSAYLPKKGYTIPPMGESRFGGGASAWSLVKGKLWYTNGHGAWKGEFPKKWPARDVNAKGPDIERVIPEKKGAPVEPIGFTRWEDNKGPRSTIFWSDGSAMDRTLYDHTLTTAGGDVKWFRGTDKQGAFQAYTKDGLAAVVMPIRSDIPEGLSPFVKEKAGEPAPTKKNPRSGGVQLDLLTLGLPAFIREDVAPALRTVATGLRDTFTDGIKLIAPSLLDRSSKLASLVMRGHIGELARRTDQARHSVQQAEKYFNKQAAEDNFDFMDRMERGRPQKNEYLDGIAADLRKLYDERREMVQDLGTGKLRSFYENYFAHIWAKPERAKTVMQAFFGKRPLEGSKSFLKKRTYPTIADGRAAGLEPVTDNPVTMTLLKIREMDKYIAGHRILKDPAMGARYVDARTGKAPYGYRQLEDPIGTVYGQSIQQIAEFPNQGLWEGLKKVADALGIKHERGFLKLGQAIGRAQQGGGIKTMHGTAEDVVAHEIGHQIDWLSGSGRRFVTEYPDAATVGRIKRARATLKDKGSTLDDRRDAREELKALSSAIAQRKEFAKQLRDLADLRGGRKEYTRKREEKMAQLAEMWVGSRELFERTAPKVFAEWKAFLDENPKLHALRDIEGDTEVSPIAQPYDVGGLVIRGHWYLPDGAARMVDNYLSAGLGRYAPFRAAMGLNNAMNLFNLGLSGFHLTKTAFEAVLSTGGIGVEQLLRGHPVKAARYIAAAPAAPFTSFMRGSKYLKEWYTPGAGGSGVGAIMDELTKGGARARLDQMYRTQISEKLVQALYRGNLPGAAIRAPFAGMEAMTRAIMDQFVPRMKLGAMAEMAAADLDRLGPDASAEDVRRIIADTVNSIDNRMGEVARDNFFTHRYLKDFSMFMMRADQYFLGTVREIGGAAVDVARQPMNALRGEPVNLKRLSYVASMVGFHMAASALYQYLHTGKWPEESEDYFYPKNGQTDEHGHPERTSLMSYVKDVHSFARHPVTSLENKIAPAMAMVGQLMANRDFWHVRISNPEDSWLGPQRYLDTGKYVVKQFEPRSVENALRQKNLGASPSQQAEQFVGLSPAPADLDQSAAERLAHELGAHDFQTRTPEAAARSELRSQYTRAIRNRQQAPPEVLKALREGTLSREDLKMAQDAAKRNSLQRAFLSLTIDDATKVYSAATKAEKLMLYPIFKQKFKNALKREAPADRAKTLADVKAALKP